MTTMPANYYQRFDPSKEYDEHLFISGRSLQGAELNEIQKNSAQRLRDIADVLFKDGSLVRDASILVNESTGVTQCQSGAVYVAGAVRGLAPATFTIPVVGVVAVGVRLFESVVTSLTDPALRDPATATRNFDEEGAERLRVHSAWGWSGDGLDDAFYPIYEVINGIVSPKEPPPNLDAVTQALARYDRDSAGGSYIVSGMDVTKLADVSGDQVYSIREGRARVFGYGVEYSTARRVNYTTAPDLRGITSEPHTSSTVGAQRIDYSSAPGTTITALSITSEKTVTLTHGAFTGAQDPLPDTSVLSIISVVQGGTTYVATADYLLTSNKVDWTPGGGEPAPGSTYNVTYRYIQAATPTAVDSAGFTVTGAVVGTLILVSYSQMLPRIDCLCLDVDGHQIWIKGVAAAYNQLPPQIPNDLLMIATVYQTWTDSRSVSSNGVRMVAMPALASIDSRFDRILQLIAQQRLESNIHTREGGAKKGIFVDPFLDDSQRDAGTVQTGAVFGGLLVLPITATAHQMGSDIAIPTSMLYTAAVSLSQTLKTGFMKINPYMAFSAMPADVTLVPAIDRWVDIVTTWMSPITRILRGRNDDPNAKTGNVLITATTTQIENLRPITVNYSVTGFGALESLASLTFDGISLATGGAAANPSGVMTGSFVIPSNVPAGAKLVRFVGAGGTVGQSSFFGQGQLRRETWQHQTIVRYDPLAQTFTLDKGVQAVGVDLWFTVLPTTKVFVQVRETTAGVPNQNIIAQAALIPAAIVTGGASTRFNFDAPALLTSGVEYAVVVLCNDSFGCISVAELGKFDSTVQRWITSQPYSVGTLLSSSNASTWTAHQDRDMTFRLLAAEYTQTQRTIALGNVAVSGATDLMLLASAEQPSSLAYVEYLLTLPDLSVLTVASDQPVILPAPTTGNIAVSAVLHGTSEFSPVLRPGSQLVAGVIGATGTYVSRAIPAGAAVTIKIIYEALVPGGSTVAAAYKGPDIGDTWATIGSPVTRNVDDGFVEFVHTVTGVTEVTIQARLTLTGTTVARPEVRDLRVIVL